MRVVESPKIENRYQILSLPTMQASYSSFENNIKFSVGGLLVAKYNLWEKYHDSAKSVKDAITTRKYGVYGIGAICITVKPSRVRFDSTIIAWGADTNSLVEALTQYYHATRPSLPSERGVKAVRYGNLVRFAFYSAGDFWSYEVSVSDLTTMLEKYRAGENPLGVYDISLVPQFIKSLEQAKYNIEQKRLRRPDPPAPSPAKESVTLTGDGCLTIVTTDRTTRIVISPWTAVLMRFAMAIGVDRIRYTNAQCASCTMVRSDVGLTLIKDDNVDEAQIPNRMFSEAQQSIAMYLSECTYSVKLNGSNVTITVTSKVPPFSSSNITYCMTLQQIGSAYRFLHDGIYSSVGLHLSDSQIFIPVAVCGELHDILHSALGTYSTRGGGVDCFRINKSGNLKLVINGISQPAARITPWVGVLMRFCMNGIDRIEYTSTTGHPSVMTMESSGPSIRAVNPTPDVINITVPKSPLEEAKVQLDLYLRRYSITVSYKNWTISIEMRQRDYNSGTTDMGVQMVGGITVKTFKINLEQFFRIAQGLKGRISDAGFYLAPDIYIPQEVCGTLSNAMSEECGGVM